MGGGGEEEGEGRKGGAGGEGSRAEGEEYRKELDLSQLRILHGSTRPPGSRVYSKLEAPVAGEDAQHSRVHPNTLSLGTTPMTGRTSSPVL